MHEGAVLRRRSSSAEIRRLFTRPPHPRGDLQEPLLQRDPRGSTRCTATPASTSRRVMSATRGVGAVGQHQPEAARDLAGLGDGRVLEQ